MEKPQRNCHAPSVRYYAANLTLLQTSFQWLTLRNLLRVANDLARRGIARDGVTALQNVRRRKQTQAGFKRGKAVAMPIQPLADLFAQTAIKFTQVLLAALQQLPRTNPEQT